MERSKERLQIARKALDTLPELVEKPSHSAIERDAMIQRFEYTFEAVWKAAQVYPRIIDGLTANSLKSAVRSSWQTGLLDQDTAKLALQLCEAHNLTVKTYNKALAMALAQQIKEYSHVLHTWLSAMEQKTGEISL